MPKTILVVDDEERLCSLLRAYFEQEGYRVLTAHDGVASWQISREEKPDGVHIWVQDTGPGIPPQDLERIFDRLYRADPSRQRHDGGSGLGLAIARSLVMLQGGRIWARNTSPQGACFTIALPYF